MKTILSLLLLLGISLSSSAQAWLRTQRISDSLINANSNAFLGHQVDATCIDTDPNGNVLIAVGFKTGSGSQARFYLLLRKYSESGLLLWSRYFDTPANANSGSFKAHCYDLKCDRWGNVYLLARNLSRFHSTTISDGISTENMLVKVNAQGRLLWRRAVGAFEDGFSAPQFARLATHPSAPHLYVYFENRYASMRFLDSIYTQPSATTRMVLVRVDSAGRVQRDVKLPNTRSSSVYGGLDVDAQDRVLLTGSAFGTPTIMDTTLTMGSASYPGTFHLLLNGANLSRIGIQSVRMIGNVSHSSLDAQFTGTGRIGYLYNVSSASSGQPAQQIIFGRDTVTLNLLAVNENPHLFVTGIDGSLVGWTSAVLTRRVLPRGTRLVADRQGSLYFGGSMSVMNGAGNERFVPIWYKADANARIQWVQWGSGGDSLRVFAPVMAAASDYPVLLTTVGGPSRPVFGADTIQLPTACSSCSFAMVSTMGGRSNAVRGRVFIDRNSNGVFDATDRALTNMPLRTADGTEHAFTDAAGNYLLLLDSGDHEISIPGRSYHRLVPAAHQVTFNGWGQTLVGRDFGLRPDSSVIDVAVDVVHIGPSRPASQSYVWITVRNKGVLPASGTYSLKLPPPFQFAQSDSTPVYAQDDSVAWTYSNLEAQASFRTLAVLRLPAQGTGSGWIPLSVSVTPLAGDTVRADNFDTVLVQLRGPYDPNDKQVMPSHVLRIDSAQAGHYQFDYTVRFQNTGNDTAFYVRIADTLSPLLDPATLQLIGSSHPVEAEWLRPNVLYFNFHNIQLPDSNVNEPRSHGFVQFRIRPYHTMSVSDSIRNNVSIYFDYEAPIVTNTALSTFRSNLVTAVPRLRRNEYRVGVFPNPAGNTVRYQVEGLRPAETIDLRLLHAGGQVLRQQRLQAPDTALQGQMYLGNLPAGIYFLHVQGKAGSAVVPVLHQ